MYICIYSGGDVYFWWVRMDDDGQMMCVTLDKECKNFVGIILWLIDVKCLSCVHVDLSYDDKLHLYNCTKNNERNNNHGIMNYFINVINCKSIALLIMVCMYVKLCKRIYNSLIYKITREPVSINSNIK